MKVAIEAVRRGIIAREDAARIGPEQAWVLDLILGFMDDEEIQDHSVCEFDKLMYQNEVMELGDYLDLQECDTVEEGKTFRHEEVSVNIPDFLVPFMRSVVLPAIREILETGD